MSLYAVVDGEDFGQIATIKGWSDFVEWAENQHYSELAHLAEYGYATHVLKLANSIYSALLDDKPSSDIESTALGIEEICRANWKSEIFIVTDGSSDDDYEDDEDDDVSPEKGKSLKRAPGAKSRTPKKVVTKKKSAAKKAPVKKAVAKTKSAAKKAPVKSTSTAKRPASKGVKKKTPAKNTSTKSSPAKKAAKKKR